MVPAATGGITSFLEGNIMGLPMWVVLAAAAGAVWYMTKGKE